MRYAMTAIQLTMMVVHLFAIFKAISPASQIQLTLVEALAIFKDK
jgi:hypothetical protein